MVTWIIGLSGSGKTTLAEQVLLDLKKEEGAVQLLWMEMLFVKFGEMI